MNFLIGLDIFHEFEFGMVKPDEFVLVAIPSGNHGHPPMKALYQIVATVHDC